MSLMDEFKKTIGERDKRIAYLESEVEKYLAMTRREKTEYHKMAERIAELEHDVKMRQRDNDELNIYLRKLERQLAEAQAEIQALRKQRDAGQWYPMQGADND